MQLKVWRSACTRKGEKGSHIKRNMFTQAQSCFRDRRRGTAQAAGKLRQRTASVEATTPAAAALVAAPAPAALIAAPASAALPLTAVAGELSGGVAFASAASPAAWARAPSSPTAPPRITSALLAAMRCLADNATLHHRTQRRRHDLPSK